MHAYRQYKVSNVPVFGTYFELLLLLVVVGIG